MTTANAPMQSRWTGSSSRASRFARKSFQGEGISEGIANRVRPHVAQQVPLLGFCGAMCAQPATLRLVQVFAEGIFSLQLAIGKCLFQRLQIFRSACQSGESHREAQAVLQSSGA